MYKARLTIVIFILAACLGGCYEGTPIDDSPVQTWARTYGGSGFDGPMTIIRVSSGGFVIGGTSESSSGYGAMLLMLDSGGGLVWQKFIEGYDRYEISNVHETPDGGFIAVGRAVKIDEGTDIDLWIFKVDASGNLLWERRFGDIHMQEAYSIDRGHDGGYIVAGHTGSLGTGGLDLWVLKIDDYGAVLWEKVYGGPMDELAYSVRRTSDNGYVVAGNIMSYDEGGGDLWILKLDSNGDPLWQKTYGGADREMFPGIMQTSDGGYLVSASTRSFGEGNNDVWIVKLDQSGNILWQKSYGGPEVDAASFALETVDGGYIVTGASESFVPSRAGAWILELNASGDILWQKLYTGPGDSVAECIAVADDGGFAVAGWIRGYGAGDYDVWVLKMDEKGDIHGGCPEGMIMDTDATVTDTAAQVADTFVTPLTSGIVERESGAVATDSDFIVMTQCERE